MKALVLWSGSTVDLHAVKYLFNLRLRQYSFEVGYSFTVLVHEDGRQSVHLKRKIIITERKGSARFHETSEMVR